MTYRGSEFEEMDLDAVLARRPEVALVDELAHTNVPGSRNEKRWQDVEELLAAGITVISTVNIQHLESVNDVVERITGIAQQETVPDDVVRAADAIELVDMSPDALRRRLAHGNVYAAEKIDAALANYFREGNLTALRELALLWVADQVDDALDDYRARHGITDAWETRERIVVAVTGAPSTENLIRRAARIAQRSHGELVGVHVRGDDGLADAGRDTVDRFRALLAELGGRFVEVAGSDVAATLVGAARMENATQLVLGATSRNRWHELTRGSVINRVIRLSGPIDVHVISATDDPAIGRQAQSRMGRVAAALPPRRRALGWATALIGLPLLTVALIGLRDDLGLPAVLLLYLSFAVGVAAVGGGAPALVAALAGFLCANWYFTPPLHTWTVGHAENVVALVVFLAVAGVVSVLVSTVARRAAEVTRAGAEAETLARIAGALPSVDPLPELVEHVRTTFALDGVALLARTDGDGWRVETRSGERVPTSPDDADVVATISDRLVLAGAGRHLGTDDRRVLRAFAASLAASEERRRLGVEAAQAATLAQANELRSALLQAVSHDLRTPLASIKAAASSLRQSDVDWTDEDRADLLATVEEETDRLTTLVANLLDMSRISAGVLRPSLRPVLLEEVVPAVVIGCGDAASRLDVDVPERLPPVLADPALLERAVANLVQNALEHGGGKPVVLCGEVVADRMHLRVIDRGPGIAPADRDRILQPFQRLGDTGTGVGLGLAVASGFIRLMGGDLVVEDTPGGGATMVVELDVVSASDERARA
jgi:two-component system sensor histidine kinase KdpD